MLKSYNHQTLYVIGLFQKEAVVQMSMNLFNSISP